MNCRKVMMIGGFLVLLAALIFLSFFKQQKNDNLILEVGQSFSYNDLNFDFTFYSFNTLKYSNDSNYQIVQFNFTVSNVSDKVIVLDYSKFSCVIDNEIIEVYNVQESNTYFFIGQTSFEEILCLIPTGARYISLKYYEFAFVPK